MTTTISTPIHRHRWHLKLADRLARIGRLIFDRVFRSSIATECRVTIHTRGLVPALNGTRHLSPKDRVGIALPLNEILKHNPEKSDLVRVMVRGTRHILGKSKCADKKDRAYLVSWLKELLRQHADQSDLVTSVGIEFSPRELAALTSSLLFDCTWRLLVPMFISRGELSRNLEQIYCFGCGGGRTVSALKIAFDSQGLKLPHLNLFDSFSGLPSEQDGVTTNTYWRKGSYSSGVRGLRNKLDKLGIAASQYRIYEGFYSESLNPAAASAGDLKPALYIDIDCDLYISTFQALDFMFSSNLATAGTYIGYDDWGDTKTWLEGESRAHKEISEKYGVDFEECFSWGRAPVVRKLFRVVHCRSV
jgi:Macrocin-O-methyltransferase (TylF)